MGSEGLEHHRRCWIEAAQGLTGVEVAAALRSEQRQGARVVGGWGDQGGPGRVKRAVVAILGVRAAEIAAR